MHISIDTILAISGIVLTLFLGYLSLRYTIKYSKRPEITFIFDDFISLENSFVNGFSEIELKYQGEKLERDLYLFRGTIVNNGNVDIEKELVIKPLEIKLTPHYRWLTQRVTKKSEELNLDSGIQRNRLAFEWDLFKVGEFFSFESMIEYKKIEKDFDFSDFGPNFFSSVKLSHRIRDLKEITMQDEIPEPLFFKQLVGNSILILSVVALSFFLTLGRVIFPDYRIEYKTKQDSVSQFVQLEAKNSNLITVLDSQRNKIALIDPKMVLQKIGADVRIVKHIEMGWPFWIILGTGVLFFIIWIEFIRGEIRKRRIYRDIYEMRFY